MVPTTRAAVVFQLASALATQASSERELAIFIRDQIDGRDTPLDSTLAETVPGYAEDIAGKVVVFMLGLLAKKEDLAERLEAALLMGGHALDIRLSAVRVNLQLASRTSWHEASFDMTDRGGL